MLEIRDAFGGLAVDDLEAARAFYGGVLGFPVHESPMGFPEFELPSGGRLFVYDKPDHVPAAFTVLNLVVPDLDTALAALAGHGVTPVQYGMPGQGEDGVVRPAEPGHGPTICWILDPAGNVVAVIEQPE